MGGAQDPARKMAASLTLTLLSGLAYRNILSSTVLGGALQPYIPKPTDINPSMDQCRLEDLGNFRAKSVRSWFSRDLHASETGTHRQLS